MSGFTGCFFLTNLICTLDPTTRIILAQVCAATQQNELVFTIDNIINPSYAKTTSSFVIYALDASQNISEVSDQSFTVTASPGTLTSTLTSANDQVGSRGILTVALTLTNTIPETGTITMLFPKWNPDDSTPESVINVGSG